MSKSFNSVEHFHHSGDEQPKEATERPPVKRSSSVMKRLMPLSVAASLLVAGMPETAEAGKVPTSASLKPKRATLNAFNDHGVALERGVAEQFKMERFEEQKDIKKAIEKGELVRVPDQGEGFIIRETVGSMADANLEWYRYVQPQTLNFILRLGRQYARKTSGQRFVIGSMVRSCKYQRRLAKENRNATGCGVTSHVTGATIDILSRTIPRQYQAWFEGILLYLEGEGKAQVTKERGQPVYHVMVYPTYTAKP